MPILGYVPPWVPWPTDLCAVYGCPEDRAEDDSGNMRRWCPEHVAQRDRQIADGNLEMHGADTLLEHLREDAELEEDLIDEDPGDEPDLVLDPDEDDPGE